jgi:tetratricopeptide (TPR) repeat protein
LHLGSLQIRQGAVAQGELLLEQALTQADEEGRVTIMHEYGKIARHFFTSNQFEHAVKYYQHAIALGATDLGHYVDLGVALESTGDYEVALTFYRQALEQSPDLSFIAFRVDAILGSTENHEARIDFWKSMAQQFPGAVTPQLHLGMAYETAGDSPTTKEAYEQVLTLTPDHVNALCALGGLLLAEGNQAEGMTLLDRALAIPDQHSSALAAAAFSKAAQAFYDKAEYGTAAEYYRRAIDLDKTNVGNLALLGKCVEALGDVDEALLLYGEVMKRAPESPQTAGQIDALYIRAGKQGEITELWKQYVGMHPTAAIPHYHLGLAFVREGLHGQALEVLERALAIDPNLNAALELRTAIIAETVQ